jgi:hypothetical protein
LSTQISENAAFFAFAKIWRLTERGALIYQKTKRFVRLGGSFDFRSTVLQKYLHRNLEPRVSTQSDGVV